MHDGIRLLSKPSKPQICLLICAAVRKDMSEVVKYSCYKIENCFGVGFDIYARSDEDFYKKLMRNSWSKMTLPTNPSIF